MEIPLELKGEQVKKFEEEIGFLLDGVGFATASEDINDCLLYKELYTQPFQPEMIEKYFEGWTIEKPFNISYSNGKDFIIKADNLRFTINQCDFPVKPQSLSDFIDYCLNSKIELKWKE